jgi:hypothetical protein
MLQGLDVKQSVRTATTANVGTYTATAGSTRGQITGAPNVLDGVTLIATNRILVKNSTNGAANGIYVVTTAGTGAGVWDRATDFDADTEVTANAFVHRRTTLADTAWVLTTNDSITVGGAAGTAMTFTQFAGAGVGISAISIATVNGLQGSSGGNSPVITLSTTLAAGPVKSNGAGAFISQAIALGGAEVSGTLAVGNGGTGLYHLLLVVYLE